MAKYQVDAMLDAALSYITTNVTQIVLCSGQPADRAGALADHDGGGSNVGLGEEALVTGDFDAIAPATSGRKLTVPEVADVIVDVTGTATHVALISATALLYVTTCVSQTVTATNQVTIPEWDIEMRDAV